MNIKDEHTSRLWTFIMKGEIMAFELDDDEMIATRVNNKAASWKEVEEYIEKYYVKKVKIREKIEELDKKMAEDEVDEFGIHSQGWAALDWTRDFLLELLQEGDK